MIYLFPIFIATTLIEIYFLIKVGEVVGAFSTILLIILTAFLGSFLLKYQGITTLNNAQKQMSSGVMPTFEMLEGVIILISGVLLLTPGFLTDFIGLLGLLPFSRRYLIDYFIAKNHNKYQQTKTKYSKDDEIIEVEFWRE
jgi:UPF0716 protein FxsA